MHALSASWVAESGLEIVFGDIDGFAGDLDGIVRGRGSFISSFLGRNGSFDCSLLFWLIYGKKALMYKRRVNGLRFIQ